jgi:hypothetical protein
MLKQVFWKNGNFGKTSISLKMLLSRQDEEPAGLSDMGLLLPDLYHFFHQAINKVHRIIIYIECSFGTRSDFGC